MHRLLFEKVGNGIYLSHLDLMRVFQRAFLRAGVSLKHSSGFSPRAYVSVALPLSVGVESVCELLDYELANDAPVPGDLAQRLNATMPEGIRVLEVYESDRKIRDLGLLRAQLTLEYDGGVPENAISSIEALLNGESVIVPKHTKRGEVETDILPMISEWSVSQTDVNTISVNVLVAAQEPSLNPLLLITAIERYQPECAPDFAICRRVEVYDRGGAVFR